MSTVTEHGPALIADPESRLDLISDLRGHPFLRGLSEEHLQLLADVAIPITLESGKTVFRKGESANRFYLILKGKVAVQTRDAFGEELLVEELGAGDVLGWSWLFPPYQWRFDARPLIPTKAVFLHGSRLRDLCEENLDLGYDLVKRTAGVVVHRLQAALGNRSQAPGPSPSTMRLKRRRA
jgi:CRP/FNR family transcriptional regulator, cyclic AMP receptor protein